MNCRTGIYCLLLILTFFALSVGCITVSPGTNNTSVGQSSTAVQDIIAEQMASVKSDNPIWREAYRMYANMKSTRYSHNTSIDEMQGRYQFDCLGFVNSVMMNADPVAYHDISRGFNASILSYAVYFGELDNGTPNTVGWTKVPHPSDLKPGDICLWLKPDTFDVGHMWIISGEPVINPNRSNEVLVRVLDSTPHVHSDDSRTGSANRTTGLGTGILGMMVDGEGTPIGLYWDGGTSPAGEKDTTIICGRLNR